MQTRAAKTPAHLALLIGWLLIGQASLVLAEPVCPEPGRWVVAGEDGQRSTSEVLERYQDAQVILLGEQHDRAEDHRWQLHLLAALHGRRPDMSVGFEMLPRRSQDALDAWLRHELDEDDLLRQSNWFEVWGHASSLYLPLFQFARMHGIPAYGLNVDRDTVRRVGRDGWHEVPAAEREHVGPAAEPPEAYVDEMRDVLAYHPAPDGVDEDDYLEQFVRSQTVWDRAMAEKLAEAAERHDGPAVAIVGRGHTEYGRGIPHQLADLGVERIVVLLPHRNGEPCLDEPPYPAHALFGVTDSPSDTRIAAPRLGIAVTASEKGLTVTEVNRDGAADRAGIRQDDILIRAGDQELRERSDLLALLDRQQPGNMLTLEVLRDGSPQELLIEL